MPGSPCLRVGNHGKILVFLRKSVEKNLPVRHYFCLSSTVPDIYNISTSEQLVKIGTILAFPSEKCLKFLPVHHYFYLSRTGGQSVISIPERGPVHLCMQTFLSGLAGLVYFRTVLDMYQKPFGLTKILCFRLANGMSVFPLLFHSRSCPEIKVSVK